MTWTPRVTVAAVIERNSEFLLVEELIDGERVLNQPAGHLEAGEDLKSAVIREVREETARDFHPTALVGIYLWPMPGGDRSYLRFCFTGTVGERHPGQSLDEDILDACWLDYATLQAYPRLRSPMVLQCVEDYLTKPRAPLELLREWHDPVPA